MDSRARRRWTILVVVAVVVLAVFGVSLWVTGEPWFCASCHEMTPTVDAWVTAPHHKYSCFACHSNPGPFGYLRAHIGDGLRDVYVHWTNPPELATGAVVPNTRCLRCHQKEFNSADFTNVHPVGPDTYCPRCHRHQAHSTLKDELTR